MFAPTNCVVLPLLTVKSCKTAAFGLKQQGRA